MNLVLEPDAPFNTLMEVLMHLPMPQRESCLRLYLDHQERIDKAHGSSHNHQAWEGGFVGHLIDMANIARMYYATLTQGMGRILPFPLEDVYLAIFFHDLEKPWKKERNFQSKMERHLFRIDLARQYGVDLSEAQENAILYAEGEGVAYRNDARVMNELAGFVHACDVTSARVFHDHPRKE